MQLNAKQLAASRFKTRHCQCRGSSWGRKDAHNDQKDRLSHPASWDCAGEHPWAHLHQKRGAGDEG